MADLQRLYDKLYKNTIEPRRDTEREKTKQELLALIEGKTSDCGKIKIEHVSSARTAGSQYRKVDIVGSDCDVLVQISGLKPEPVKVGQQTNEPIFSTEIDSHHIVHLFYKTIKSCLKGNATLIVKHKKGVAVKVKTFEFDLLPMLIYNNMELVANDDSKTWTSSKRIEFHQDLNEATQKYARAKEVVRILKFISYKFEWNMLPSFYLEMLVIQYSKLRVRATRLKRTRDCAVWAMKLLRQFPRKILKPMRKAKHKALRSKICDDIESFLKNEKQLLDKWHEDPSRSEIHLTNQT